MPFFVPVEASGPQAGRVVIEGRVVRETPKAVLFESDGGKQEWLPRRYVHLTPLRGETVEAALQPWLAREKKYV